MNIFKGCLICNESQFIKELIEPRFLEDLLILHEPQDEKVEIPEEFEIYVNSLQTICDRDKNFNLLSSFQKSCYINHNDWEGSFSDYLKKIYICLSYNNPNTLLIKKIKDLLETYEINNHELKSIQKVRKEGLDLSFFFTSMISIAFENISSKFNYDLKSLIFIDKINEISMDLGFGTSFWFIKDNDLLTISIYKTILKREQNLLFNFDVNPLDKLINAKYGKMLNRKVKIGKRYKNKKCDDFVTSMFNRKFIDYSRLDLKPIYYFGIEGGIEIFHQGSELTVKQQEGILILSSALEKVEEQLYHGKIKPDLTMIFFKQGNFDLLLIQKSSPSASLSVIYKIRPGEQKFIDFLTIHKKIMGDLLSRSMEENGETFISEIQDYFLTTNKY